VHSPHFLRLLQLDPATSIVFAGANGLSMLANSKYVIVDDTFELVEMNLVLTMIMGYHDGIAILCVYYLSELKTHKSYLLFFQVSSLLSFYVCLSLYCLPSPCSTCLCLHSVVWQKIKDLTNGRMDPTGYLLDFEEAMASVWTKAFPNCNIMCDFFHLQQANTKKMAKLGLSDLRKEIVQDIRVMWYADTKVAFDQQLDKFLAKWDEKAPQYSEYFRRVWVGQHPPNTWASYARGKDVPSGWFEMGNACCFLF
jgi:hypothetical protein